MTRERPSSRCCPCGGASLPEVLVAGAGAIGQWLGLRLLQAGHQVALLTRPEHAQAIASGGLEVHGESSMRGHPTCVTDARGLAKFQAIIVTSKAHQTAAVAKQVAHLLAPDGVALSLQNGFGNAVKLARVFGSERVAVATTAHGVDLERPGRLLHAGTGATHVGPSAPLRTNTLAARAAYSLLASAGLDPQWHDAMQIPVWRKGLLNHAVNPPAALAGARNGAMLGETNWGHVEILLAEGYALSRAAGVGGLGTQDQLLAGMREVLERTRNNRCSMLQDVTNRKPTEVEQLTGHLCRLARRLGYPMPRSDSVYRDIKALEASYLGEAAALRLTREEVEVADLLAPF